MSGICGAAQTRRTAGALDPTEGTNAIDRAALERGIALYKSALGSGAIPTDPEALKAILASAEAHLATLPEPPKTRMVEVKRWVTFRYKRGGDGDGHYILDLRAHQYESTGEHGQWVTFNVEVPA